MIQFEKWCFWVGILSGCLFLLTASPLLIVLGLKLGLISEETMIPFGFGSFPKLMFILPLLSVIGLIFGINSFDAGKYNKMLLFTGIFINALLLILTYFTSTVSFLIIAIIIFLLCYSVYRWVTRHYEFGLDPESRLFKIFSNPIWSTLIIALVYTIIILAIPCDGLVCTLNALIIFVAVVIHAIILLIKIIKNWSDNRAKAIAYLIALIFFPIFVFSVVIILPRSLFH